MIVRPWAVTMRIRTRLTPGKSEARLRTRSSGAHHVAALPGWMVCGNSGPMSQPPTPSMTILHGPSPRLGVGLGATS